MNELLNKFDSVQIHAVDQIPKEDVDACNKLFEKANHVLESLNKKKEIIQKLYDEDTIRYHTIEPTSYNNDSTIRFRRSHNLLERNDVNIKVSYDFRNSNDVEKYDYSFAYALVDVVRFAISLKYDTIEKIINHFNKKYNLDISLPDLTITNIDSFYSLKEIIKHMSESMNGNLDLMALGISNLIKSFHNKAKYCKHTLKGVSIEIDSYYWPSRSGYGSNDLEKQDEFITLMAIIRLFENEELSFEKINIDRFQPGLTVPLITNKCVSIKAFLNRKVQLKFSDENTASQFYKRFIETITDD